MTGRPLVFGCAAWLLIACSKAGSNQAEQQQAATPPPAAEPAVPADVQLAVTVAQAIDAAPTKGDSILTANGLTRPGLDSLMYVIAADSTKAAAYAAARP